MNSFEYLSPATIDEVGRLLDELPEAKALAGGMSLLSAMKLRLSSPSHLIDLRRIGVLKGIRLEGGELVIGAMTRHAEVAAHPLVKTHLPALAILAGGIGDRQVRNRGTLGGSLANADPAACYAAGVLGLGASLVTSRRQIPADEFFVDLFTTALDPTELLTEVRFPLPARAAYLKFHQPASRFALVGVMVSQAVDGGIRVGVTGAKAYPFRAAEIEQALGARLHPSAAAAVELAPDDMNADMHADAVYRARMVSVIAARAVQAMCQSCN